MKRPSILTIAAAFALAISLLAQTGGTLTDEYRDTATKLIDAALADRGGMDKLSYLCDRIGHRLSGSQGLENAVVWAAQQMKADGLVNVVTPRVKVPHWVRGNESAALVEPMTHPLTILGLGGSVATPKRGITADVVPVSSFEDLDKHGRAGIEGKIVLFNVPFEGYNRTVTYRNNGPSRAARLGAVAALVRSVTPVSLETPHTGALEYADGFPKIPAAAVTIEDALLMQRLVDAGNRVVVHLEMEAHYLPDADSANVIGDIPGRERPDEIVVIGGHLDSWDVGAGAQDDGSGCITALEAAHIIHMLGLRPRRTLRVAFWTNEENGGAGGEAYRAWAGDTVRNHVAAIEMDGGAEKPLGFGVSSSADLQELLTRLHEVGLLLDRINAGSIQPGGGGADIAPIMAEGVPGLALRTVGTHYFDWHHTRADTTDKVKIEDLRANIAAMAVMAYVLADMPAPLRPVMSSTR
ncbi:MAG TPA: M20/M25/M40 family metallo-hydrolase [Bryobacteraceae bacterium]|nr:M20/M25/M40 family metallo-hydrolase [Bryobacteraceae bacterium]